MSYNLLVWEQPAGGPLPATLHEASAMVRALEGSAVRPGGNLASFARQLPPELQAAADVDSPVMVVGMPQADRLRFIRRTVDAARGHRLTVLDDQLGLVFLPTGAVLPPEGAPLWNAVLEQLNSQPAPLGKAEAEKLLRRDVGEVLAPHGFRLVPESRYHVEFARALPDGVQQVQFWIRGAGTELRCAVVCKVLHHRVVELYQRFCGASVPGGGEWSLMVDVSELLGEKADTEFPVAHAAEIQALAATIGRVVVPRLDEWTTIADVDRLVHRDGRLPAKARFAGLIVAALAGNGDFERLAESLRAAKSGHDEELRGALERLIEHLRGLRPSPASP